MLHGNAKRAGNVLAHLGAIRRHLGPLGLDNAVHVHDGKALLAGHTCHLGHHYERVRSLVGGVGVREEHADVVRAHGAEHGVGHGVRQHVRVGVAQKAQLVRDVHAAQDELAALHEPVHVNAQPYPHHASHATRARSSSRASRMAFAMIRSPGTVTLMLPQSEA